MYAVRTGEPWRYMYRLRQTGSEDGLLGQSILIYKKEEYHSAGRLTNSARLFHHKDGVRQKGII